MVRVVGEAVIVDAGLAGRPPRREAVLEEHEVAPEAIVLFDRESGARSDALLKEKGLLDDRSFGKVSFRNALAVGDLHRARRLADQAGDGDEKLGAQAAARMSNAINVQIFMGSFIRHPRGPAFVSAARAEYATGARAELLPADAPRRSRLLPGRDSWTPYRLVRPAPRPAAWRTRS